MLTPGESIMAPYNITSDFFFLIFQLILRLWREGSGLFFTALVIGLVLAGGAWWLSHWIALNYNRFFSFRLRHHVFCGLAALATLIFTLVFVGFRYTEDVAKIMVSRWETRIQQDRNWSRNTFTKAYEAVYDLRDSSGARLEDFTGHPHPKTGRDTSIPTSHERSQEVAAEIYAQGAVEHFQDTHPFLSKILWARSDTAQKVIVDDVQRVFASGASFYRAQDAIEIAGEIIRKGLEKQTPRVVLISRTLLIIAFLVVQAVTIGLLIWAALADIRENFSPQPINEGG
jgi:hypothetical protein